MLVAASSVEPPKFSTSQLLQTALKHHQAGHLSQAEALYRQILEREPKHPDALHYLGVLAHQSGKLDTAVALITSAISISPRSATYYCNLGCVLQKQGRAEEAVSVLQQSLVLEPNFAKAHFNLGLALEDQNRFDEAIASYQAALAIKQDYGEAYGNLAYIFSRQGKMEEAIVYYRQAAAFGPTQPEAHFNFGNALLREGKLDEAIASYRLAIACKADYTDAHNNLGTALKSQGRLDEAVASYQGAIRSNPHFPQAYVNLSIALHAQGKYAEAITACRGGLFVAPDVPELHFNLGNAFQWQGNLDGAVAAHQRAIALKPDYAEAYGNLGGSLQEQGKVKEAVAAYEKAIAIRPNYLDGFSNLIYLHAFAHDISPEEQCRVAAGWERAALSDEERTAARNRTFVNPPRAGRKLRLGIVSAELGKHAVAEFLQPFLDQRDRSRFHLTLYPTRIRSGPRAEQIRESADQFISLAHLSDRDAAEQIRSDGIDVLMDTSGHTNNCRLGIFAHRAAPVQCTYIGFWASTGLTEMDWYIADCSLPESCNAQFSERIWRMPRLGGTYRGETTLPESTWKPAEDGTIWLGSFNKYSKMREESLALWARVLHAIPKARLLLEDRTSFDDQLHPRILAELARHGIGFDRIEFSPYNPGWESHMLLYNRLDIALDTIPFNSGTTAYDAVWMGVPLVALEGDWGGGRMASTVLRALGRPEWIASNADEYVAILAGLAHDVDLRQSIRKTQRARMAASPLFDGAGLAHDLQEAFEGMFDTWTSEQGSRF